MNHLITILILIIATIISWVGGRFIFKDKHEDSETKIANSILTFLVMCLLGCIYVAIYEAIELF